MVIELIKHILLKLGNIQVKNLNREVVQNFTNNLDLSPKTIHEIYLILKLILDYGIKQRIINTNVTINLELPSIMKVDIDFFYN